MELHLAIAQYCQKEYQDVDMVFTKSDGDKEFLNLSDKDFPLRRLGLIPINNSKKRKELEQLKQTLLNTNTLGNDMLDYAELFSADTVLELVAIGRKNRIEKEKADQTQREHEQTLVDKQLQSNAEQKEKDRTATEESKEKDRAARIEEVKIEAFGRAIDKESDQLGLNYLERVSDMAYKNQELLNKNDLNNKEIELKTQESNIKARAMTEDLNLKMKELEFKNKKLAADKFIAITNKN
jgi:hypothetical protein